MNKNNSSELIRRPVGSIIAALGIVYGDIGTSPLYAMRECFRRKDGIPVNAVNVLGILSLIFWSLVLVISLKYLLFVMKADNKGEGGILALTTLVVKIRRINPVLFLVLGTLGLFGAALLYGDGMITPAISVLSAIEGLNAATPLLKPFVVPIAIFILIVLFSFQHHGTSGIGSVFGPVMLLWFAVMGFMGLAAILHHPGVMAALNPVYAVEVMSHNGLRAFLVLGTVFLVVTGGEALYADMGHFGKGPIQAGWFAIVFPSLLLNYFGQGALLIGDPGAVDNLFYRLAPAWALYPLILLATAATVIASQAVISGAFSLTRQAVQLGYFPRLAVLHTSTEQIGQIYVPFINWILMAGTVCLVIGFRHSGNLAAAYGIAVSATMVITTILMFFVARRRWKWRLFAVLPACSVLLCIDAAFFSSNITKVTSGGWVPLLVAAAVFSVMITWRQGRKILKRKLDAVTIPLKDFLEEVSSRRITRVPGTAAFLTGNPVGTPTALVSNFMHNKILHERILILHVTTEEIPYVSPSERLSVRELGNGFFRVTLHYGFSEHPDIPRALGKIDFGTENFSVEDTIFFLGRENLLVTKDETMPVWRKHLFVYLSRSARDATKYFRISPEQVFELGIQMKL
ncbi:MAG: potassium transporter Kup [Deltaproteobacteria bacterium]|nr:potassium transporter Kup [Deltaproteobacteria bacterium]